MRKAILILIMALFLSACAAKRDDFYVFKYGVKSVAVGYDETCDDFITSKKTYDEDKKKEIITYAEAYVKDLADNGYLHYSIGDVELDTSVKSNCEKLNGRLVENKGYTCVISKNTDDKLLILELHGNILNDDMDELDHIIMKAE